MSGIRVINVQHPSSPTPNLSLSSDGNVAGTGFDLLLSETFSGSQPTYDDIFAAPYSNYKIVMKAIGSVTGLTNIRLRSSGTTDISANYSLQTNLLASTTFTGAVSTAQTSFVGAMYLNLSQYLPTTIEIFGPNLESDQTFIQIRSTRPDNGVSTWMVDGYHSLTAAYDGIIFLPQSGTIGGSIKIYGYKD